MCPLVIIWIFKFIVHQVHTDFSFYFKTSKSARAEVITLKMESMGLIVKELELCHLLDLLVSKWRSMPLWNSDLTTSKLFNFFCIILIWLIDNIFYFIFKFTNIHFNFNSNSATSDASTAPSTKSSPAIFITV